MKTRFFLQFSLILCLFVGVVVRPTPAQSTQDEPPTYRVIVALATGQTRFKNDGERVATVQLAQDALLHSLTGYEVRDITRFRYIPFLALTVQDDGLSALSNSPYVIHMEEDRFFAPMLDTSAAVIGAKGTDGAWQFGYDGRGQVIAVLDSGIDKYHPALAGQVIAEACFSTNGTLFDKNGVASNAFSLCPNGEFESVAPDSALNCTPAIDNCDHGTLISGTIASTNLTYRGIAPGAKLVAVQIFTIVEGMICEVDWGYKSPCILSLTSDQIRALEYIYSVRDFYNFTGISLSIGAGFWDNESQCDNDNFARKSIIDLLRGAGILTFSPTGNTGLSGQMLAPACISSVISVSATDDTDAIANFSNTAMFMDFFAPGANIHSLIPGGGFADKNGTSLSAPTVIGAWALLKQANKKLTPDQIYNILTGTGKPIAHNGTFSPRINLKKALRLAAVLPRTPQAHAQVNTVPLVFSWNASDGAVQYKLILKNMRTGEKRNFLLSPSICDSTLCTYTHQEALVNGDFYSWKIKATIIDGSKRNSLKRLFTVHYPDTPHLLQPSNGALITSPTALTQFAWTSLVGAPSFKLIVKDIITTEKIIKQVIDIPCAETCIYTTPQSVRDALVDGHTYQWKVKALYPTYSMGSVKWTFTTDFLP